MYMNIFQTKTQVLGDASHVRSTFSSTTSTSLYSHSARSCVNSFKTDDERERESERVEKELY